MGDPLFMSIARKFENIDLEIQFVKRYFLTYGKNR